MVPQPQVVAVLDMVMAEAHKHTVAAAVDSLNTEQEEAILSNLVNLVSLA